MKYWMVDEELFPVDMCMTRSGSVGWEPFAVMTIKDERGETNTWLYSKKQVELPDVHDDSGVLLCPFCKARPFDELNGCRCYGKDATS